ncbi:MAG TPA: protein translocase subunit SecDF, partial [Opitutaceae bacterium]|nr:protein translocase subunit SecDF [Opitutaceae bacterium]
MTLLAPTASLFRRNLWKIILTFALVAWSLSELVPLESVPLAEYARTHATAESAAFAQLADEAAARQASGQAAGDYAALQQIARERQIDLSKYFPGIWLEDTLQNVERRNDLVLGELARRAKGRVSRGLDLAGGVAITLEVDESAAGPISAEQRRGEIAKAIEIIGKRINDFGVAEPLIRPIGTNRIEVQLPDVNIRDNPDLVAQIKKPARLDFRSIHPALRPGAGVEVPAGYEMLSLEDDGRSRQPTSEELFVKRVPEFSGNVVVEARAQTDSLGRSEVVMRLTPEGADRFAELTSRLSRQGTQTGRLAIVLDGKLQSAPLVSDEIKGGIVTIKGGRMSDREALQLANVLNNPLELPLTVKEQHEVGPSLAAGAVERGVRASVIGAALVAAFMITFYATGGLVA